MSTSWDRTVFDRIYARAADPWNMETSPYERKKYASTLAALPCPRFARALEAGCSIGAQTVQLAERCDSLLALDIAAEAVRRTRERCAALPHVAVRQAQLPRDWPNERFDLIVFSEILYFLSPADIAQAAGHTLASLAPGGVVLLVNWTGETDTPTTGEQAAQLFGTAVAGTLRYTLASARENYRLDVFTQPARAQDS